jgi:hypothetical protein
MPYNGLGALRSATYLHVFHGRLLKCPITPGQPGEAADFTTTLTKPERKFNT